MTGYAWPSPTGLATALSFAGAAALAGPWLARTPPQRAGRVLARLLVVTSVVVAPLSTQADAAGTRMLLICASIFLAMKVLVQAEARGDGRPVPSGAAWLCFAFLWPGMRPWAFAGARARTRDGQRWIVLGVMLTFLGLALLGLARLLHRAGVHEALVSVVAMAGIGGVIALGAFQALAGFWHVLGRPVTPLFDAPARSRSLEEFWSRRWNRAFSEMLQLAVERPLRRRLPRRVAWTACFALSGLLHELALSVPARAGYGWPTLYFALQGTLVVLEGRVGWPGGGGGVWRQRAWTAFWVLAPLPLVFHPPAMRALVLPLLT